MQSNPYLSPKAELLKAPYKRSIFIKIIWCFYAWPISLLLLASDISSLSKDVIFHSTGLIFNLTAILGMHLYIFEKNLFKKTFWKIYTPVFIAWELFANMYLEPHLENKAFDPSILRAPLIPSPMI